MKLLLCLILLFFPNKIIANDLDVKQDRYNNIVITSSDLDYLKKVKSVEFYDGESTITIEIDDVHTSINEKMNTLTLYSSEFIHIHSGSYQVYLNAEGYDKLRADEMGCVIEKKIVNAPDDVIVNKNEKGLEIRSKIYNYIHGLTLQYNSNNSLETYSFIQFSKDENFIDSEIYENTYSKIPFSSIYIENDTYCISISNEALRSMGLEEEIYYYVQIQSASFSQKMFGSYVLVEKVENETENKADDENHLDVDDSKDEISNDRVTDSEDIKQDKNKNDSDLYLALGAFTSLIIVSAIGYILYVKNKSKK